MTQPATDTRENRLFTAVGYAKRGWHVLPLHSVRDRQCSCGRDCGNPGKHPRTRQGWKDASSDPDVVRRWWTQYPDANIGLAPGLSGLVILDIDPRNGGGESLAAIEAEHGALTETVRTVTGGAGWHYWFERPEGYETVRKMLLAEGVEVIGDSGYVVAPGSSHYSGRDYVWDAGADPSETPFAPLPEWIASRARGARLQEYAPVDAIRGVMGKAFAAAGMLGREIGGGKQTVICPWQDSHTCGSEHDSSTVVFGPTPGRRMGWFHCSHAHCAGRTQDEVFAALPQKAVRTAREAAGLDPDERRMSRPSTAAVQERPDENAWKRGLRFNDRGVMTKDLGNVVLVLTHEPRWKGTLGRDLFRDETIWTGQPPECPGMRAPSEGSPVQDSDYAYVHHWFAKNFGLSLPTGIVPAAVQAAAVQRESDDLTNYVQGLEWDGVPRVDTWLSDYLGARRTAWISTAGRLWMLQAMARALRPGCQGDLTVVLEGRQGCGKTSAMRILGGHWYHALKRKVGDKDASLELRGAWIVELEELDAIQGVDASRIKGFLTATTDRYRPPYGRNVVEYRRRCVFVGTTNEAEYLHDMTGARRFAPIEVGALKRDELERDRDQLWAEARHRVLAGEQHWPTQAESILQSTATEVRRDVDPWEVLIASWCLDRAEVTTADVMRHAVSLPPERWTRRERRRVNAILRRFGWTRHKGDVWDR